MDNDSGREPPLNQVDAAKAFKHWQSLQAEATEAGIRFGERTGLRPDRPKLVPRDLPPRREGRPPNTGAKQKKMLRALERSDIGLTTQHLAGAAGISLNYVYRATKLMEKRGLLKRKYDDDGALVWLLDD